MTSGNDDVIGLAAEFTQAALEQVKQDFTAKRLGFHGENLASQELQLLGVIFDGGSTTDPAPPSADPAAALGGARSSSPRGLVGAGGGCLRPPPAAPGRGCAGGLACQAACDVQSQRCSTAAIPIASDAEAILAEK